MPANTIAALIITYINAVLKRIVVGRASLVRSGLGLVANGVVVHVHQYQITGGVALLHAHGNLRTGWWLNLKIGGAVQSMMAVDRGDDRQVMLIWLASRIDFMSRILSMPAELPQTIIIAIG